MEDRAKKENRDYSGSTSGALEYDEVIIFDDADDYYYDELSESDQAQNHEFIGVDYEG